MEELPVTRAVSPLLPIITTVIWLIVLVIGAVVAPMSLMAFDSGTVTLGMGMLVAGVWMVVLFCPISIVGGWIAWALTRRNVGAGARTLRGVLYALPLAGALVFALAFVVGG